MLMLKEKILKNLKPLLDYQCNKILQILDNLRWMSCHQLIKLKGILHLMLDLLKVLLQQDKVKVVGMKFRLNLFSQKKSMYKEEGQLVSVNASLFLTESGKLRLMGVTMMLRNNAKMSISITEMQDS